MKDRGDVRSVAWTMGLGILIVGLAGCVTPAGGGKVVEAPMRTIKLDGRTDDWAGIPAQTARGEALLFQEKGLPREKWEGDADLSFQWRAAWSGDRLYFLIEVEDDNVVIPARKNSFMNDCVELFLDPNRKKGKRFNKDGTLNGYELHFLDGGEERVYITKYILAEPQTDEFEKKWSGEFQSAETETGYVMEIALRIPDIPLHAGKTLGIDVVVCDDDGNGRESQMTWTGTHVKFWYDMNEYGTLRLREGEL